jgi:hypothetical protein
MDKGCNNAKNWRLGIDERFETRTRCLAHWSSYGDIRKQRWRGEKSDSQNEGWDIHAINE